MIFPQVMQLAQNFFNKRCRTLTVETLRVSSSALTPQPPESKFVRVFSCSQKVTVGRTSNTHIYIYMYIYTYIHTCSASVRSKLSRRDFARVRVLTAVSGLGFETRVGGCLSKTYKALSASSWPLENPQSVRHPTISLNPRPCAVTVDPGPCITF